MYRFVIVLFVVGCGTNAPPVDQGPPTPASPAPVAPTPVQPIPVVSKPTPAVPNPTPEVKRAEVPMPSKPPEVPKVSRVATIDDVTVTVLRSYITKPWVVTAKLEELRIVDAVRAQATWDAVRVILKVENTSATRRREFIGWNFKVPEVEDAGTAASAMDEHENEYKQIGFSGKGLILDNFAGRVMLEPGMRCVCEILFEKPLPIAKQLTIKLPGRGASLKENFLLDITPSTDTFEGRTWLRNDGYTFEATLRSASDVEAVLQNRAGSTATVQISDYSDMDSLWCKIARQARVLPKLREE